MVKYQVFSCCIKYKYNTTIFSKASIIIGLINILVFLIPFLIAYRTQGLWLKSDTYREQPDVHFKYEYFILIETDRIESPVICTTFLPLLRGVAEFNNCPLIKVREEDLNRDGRNDVLYFEIQALLQSSELIQGVSMILLFDYKLYSHSWLEMESAGYLQTMFPLGGRKLEITSELRLHQRQALLNEGRDIRFNTSIISDREFNLNTVLKDYAARNVSTRLENVYTTWTRGRAVDEPFTIQTVIHYPEDSIIYTPGFWHVIKIAWIQYLSMLIPSILVGRQVKQFILGNSLVHSIKEPPWKKWQ